jgi:hypothetical protein
MTDVFWVTKTIKFSRRIHAPKSLVLSAIEDYEFLLSLNPLVLFTAVSPTDPNHLAMTIKLTLCCITIPTKYDLEFQNVDGGVDAFVDCGFVAGKMWDHYRVNDDGEGGCIVENELDVRSLRFLSWYIVGELVKTHEAIMDTLKAHFDATTQRRS